MQTPETIQPALTMNHFVTTSPVSEPIAPAYSAGSPSVAATPNVSPNSDPASVWPTPNSAAPVAPTAPATPGARALSFLRDATFDVVFVENNQGRLVATLYANRSAKVGRAPLERAVEPHEAEIARLTKEGQQLERDAAALDQMAAIESKQIELDEAENADLPDTDLLLKLRGELLGYVNVHRANKDKLVECQGKLREIEQKIFAEFEAVGVHELCHFVAALTWHPTEGEPDPIALSRDVWETEFDTQTLNAFRVSMKAALSAPLTVRSGTIS